MIVRNIEFGNGTPKICVPVMGKNLHLLEEEISDLQGLKYDLVEWRIDFYEDMDQVKNDIYVIRDLLGETPLLVTCRTQDEGGNACVSKEGYCSLLKPVISSQCCDLVDLECFLDEEIITSLVKYAHENGVKVIMSNHDFSKTPSYEEIMYRFSKMEQMQCDIAKVAYMPKDSDDVLTLLRATNDASRMMSCLLASMSMSQLGVISRISGEFFHSCMTFGCAENVSAPGQLEANVLASILEALHQR